MRVKTSEKVLPSFHDFWKAEREPYLYYVLKGGRNSAKSSTLGEKVVFNRMKYKSHALVVRKYGKYLEKSVFEQCKWAIDHFGVEQYWKEKKSPLELIYKPTGAKIIFMGADDPTRIKSIKTADYPITDLWIEEAAEFKMEEDITTVVNSIVRAELDGLSYKVFLSYNPPKRRTHWLNKKYESQFIQKNTYVHSSTYLDNPFISKQMLEEIEHTKENNRQRYEWEYLGKPIGSGIVPFQNLQFRRISQEEIDSFDNILCGIDWGYAADPFAYVRMHYDKTRRILYFIDEIYGVKMSNREAAQKIIRKGYEHDMIIADSAEPKSIAEMKTYGVRIKKAKKGPGSVEFGEKWLDDLEAIVIDHKRTPNVAREFESIDYDTDRDGNVLSRLADKDNHTIDATRYATEKADRTGVTTLR